MLHICAISAFAFIRTLFDFQAYNVVLVGKNNGNYNTVNRGKYMCHAKAY